MQQIGAKYLRGQKAREQNEKLQHRSIQISHKKTERQNRTEALSEEIMIQYS